MSSSWLVPFTRAALHSPSTSSTKVPKQVIMHKACFAGFTEKHLKGNSQVTTGFSIPLQESQPYNFCN